MALPIANAGADQLFAYSAVPFNAALDGSASSDPDGGTITAYLWTLLYSPPGSAASITGPTTATPTLANIDIEGTYLVHLQVTDSGAEVSGSALPPPAASPNLFDSLDAAFVSVVHKTENKDWRIPATYERDWANYLHSIYLQLDDAITSGVNAGARFLLNGSDASMPSAVDINSILSALTFFSASDAITPLSVRRFSATATADIFAALDELGGALVGIQADGTLDMKADLRLVEWPNIGVRQNGSNLEVRSVGAPATLVIFTSGGDIQANGRSVTINGDAVGGTPEEPSLAMRGGDGASLIEWIGRGIPGSELFAWSTTKASTTSLAAVYCFGDPTVPDASDPAIRLTGGDGADSFDIQLTLDVANTRALLTSPAANITELQLEDRMILDVDADLQVMDSVVLDQPTPATAAKVTRTTAGDVVIGTDHAPTGGSLFLRVKGADVWEVANASGELQSVGASRQIRNVTDPTLPQDVATKAYVDGVAGVALVEVTTATYAVTIETHVLVNRSPAAVCAITLPAGAAHPSGMVTIKDKMGAASAYPISVTAFGGETIDGAAVASISVDYASISLVFNGSEWSII